jgi:hypothetical protein
MHVRDEMVVKGLAARDGRASVSGRVLLPLAAGSADGLLFYDPVRR